MRIDYLLLAEGIGQDSRGAFTVIGLEQNLLITDTFPAVTKRALMGHISFDVDEVEAGTPITFGFSAISPSGRTLSATSGTMNAAAAPVPSIPSSGYIPAELFLSITEHGPHRLRFETTLNDETQSAELFLYVVQSSEVTNHASVQAQPSVGV